MPDELDRLNALSYGDLLAWLLEALHGRQPIPRLSPDEPPYVGILRLEAALDKPTRHDLAKACAELVQGFARSGQGDIEFVSALLRLAVKLELDSVAPPLARMAKNFPTLPEVPGTIKGLVLATLVDLKVTQPVDFWQSILDQDRTAFAGTAIAGLLARNPAMAIDVVPTLPDDQTLADAIAIVLEHATDQLASAQRGEVYARIRQVLPRCLPLVRGSIEEWLEERGELERRTEDDSPQSGVHPRHSNAIQTSHVKGVQAGLRRVQEKKAA